MQKRTSRGMKGWVLVLTALLLAFCLVSAGVEAKKTDPSNPNLPNGRPFQILQAEIVALQAQVANLVTQIGQINSLEKQIGTFQYELLTIPSTSGGNITITPTNIVFAQGGKDVRFEVTFVPDAATAPTDTYIMAALTSSQNGQLSFIGTNSDGSITKGNSGATFPATIATINGVASLAATTDTTYELQEVKSPPSGKYFVKIYY